MAAFVLTLLLINNLSTASSQRVPVLSAAAKKAGYVITLTLRRAEGYIESVEYMSVVSDIHN